MITNLLHICLTFRSAAITILIVLTALLWGCASVGRPGGGPEDKDPPFIINTTPETDAVNVSRETTVKFTFSEAVDPRTFSESLFISPPPTSKPKIKWHGKTARVLLPDPFPESGTMVMTVGTGLKDLHGNNIESSYSLAFTTGDRIDQGTIAGLVFGNKIIMGQMIGAWSLPVDSVINPEKSIPDYLTQSGNDSHFEIKHLTSGTYRVFCWEDKDKDRLYNPGTDMLGLPWKDVFVPMDSTVRMDFYPVKRDTGTAQILFASATDQEHVVIRFSRQPDFKSQTILTEVIVRDSVNILRVLSAWYDPADSSRIILKTDQQSAATEYQLSFWEDTTKVTFKGEARPDTIGPKLIKSFPRDGVRDAPNKLNGWISFDDMLKDTTWNDVLKITRDDSIYVAVNILKQGPNVIKWASSQNLETGVTYKLSLDLNGVRDTNGNVSGDSTWVTAMTIVDPAKTGEISGRIFPVLKETIVVNARTIKSRQADDIKAIVDDDGHYKISLLPPGEYVVWAFIDLRKNNYYDTGSLLPLEFAERFLVNSDTITVRTRWETSGVNLNFQ